MYLFAPQIMNMNKKEKGILIAGGIGFLAIISLISLRKILDAKQKKQRNYYKNLQRRFGNDIDDDDYHGIEYLAMQ